MTTKEFAQLIRQKYPDGIANDGTPYSEMDDKELTTRVLNKYPVYRAQVKDSVFKKIGDFFTSGTQKLGETLGKAASVISPEIKKTREETLSSTKQMVDDLIKKAKKETDKEKAKKILQSAQSLADTEDIDIFNNKEYQKTAKQVFGETLETGLETAMFGSLRTGIKAAKTATAGGKILKSLKGGASIGGAFGGAYGVSQAMQANKPLSNIMKQGLTGAETGAVLGGSLGGGLSSLGAGVSSLSSKIQKLQPVIKNKIGDAAYNKLLKVSRDLVKMSPTAAKNEVKWQKNTPKFLVDEGVIGLLESDGKKLSTREAVEALKEKYLAENNAFNNILADSGEYVSLNKLKERALKSISDLKTRGSDYNKAKKYITKEIEEYKNNYRDVGVKQEDDLLIPVSEFNKIKTGLWTKTSNFNPSIQEKLMSDLNYKLGHQAKEIIEDTVSDATIKDFNSRLGDFISAIKILENVEGKTVPGGFFGKQFTRIAGTIAGSGGGLPGAVIGNLTGGVLADLASNPKIKTEILNKLLKILRKNTEGRNIIKEAEEILLKRNKERGLRKLLEAPKTIQLKSSKDTSKDTSRLLSQEEAQLLLNEMKK